MLNWYLRALTTRSATCHTNYALIAIAIALFWLFSNYLISSQPYGNGFRWLHIHIQKRTLATLAHFVAWLEEFITTPRIYHSGLAPGALFANYVREKSQKFNYFSTTFSQCDRLKRRKGKAAKGRANFLHLLCRTLCRSCRTWLSWLF